ncbi:MAG: PhoH family protein [Atribacterota bacterium]
MQTILDTSVILENPQELLNHEEVLVPYCVLEELDKKKYDKKLGYKARKAVRLIIAHSFYVKKLENSENKADDVILNNANGRKVITMDGLMYLKGKSMGVDIELYEPDREIYNGISDQWIDKDLVNKLHDKHRVKVDLDLYENQFLDLGDLLCRYSNGFLHKIDWNKGVNGIEKPNKRQLMALDVLFDNKVKLVSLFGPAGSGKTTLAINSAISQAMNGEYNKVLISRPKKQRGLNEEKLGYLTGDMENKMSPFIAPFKDNLYTQTAIDFKIIPLSMIQGRSFDNSIWVITEAQDIRKENMDLVVSRAGQNTKIIMDGDLSQNSDKRLDRYNNGLTHVINTLKDSKITATVKLDKIERSGLARLANKLKTGVNK